MLFPHTAWPPSIASQVDGAAVEHEDMSENSFLDCIKHRKSSIACSWKEEEEYKHEPNHT